MLKAGGRLGLIWNKRDTSADWVKDVWALVDRKEGDLPRHRAGVWKNAFAEFTGFRPLEEKSFAHLQLVDFSTLKDRIASTSFIANMEEADRSRLLLKVRDVLQRHPDTRGKDVIEIPYRTDVYIYEAISQKPSSKRIA